MKSILALSMVVATTWAGSVHGPGLAARGRAPLDARTTQRLIKPGFSITFIDTFHGVPGTIPSSDNWIFDIGTSYPGGAERWGNHEYQSYTDSPDNVRLTHRDTLMISPRLKHGQWTSARIETQRKDFVAAPGGKLFVESRLKVGDNPEAQSKGIWPAFWALGESFRGNFTNWPSASEWDFLEVLNGQNKIYSTIHCGTAPGGPCNEYNGIGNGGVPFTRGVWNTVGFQVDRTASGKGNGTWVDESLSWFLNGEKVLTVKGSTVGDEPTWAKLAHEGHFLLFNVAVGGWWPGFPNDQTKDGTGAGLEVDYVGVWNSL
ncbi:hypothetical protein ONS95_011465 [Cadophora gregata]|uniref:uncharacterized protein n=1 Tax=Cadophora gregata TaxID=51156 RepID=UPI0026DB62E0|nr:uncharacterized protein ONS95_011465 [Cadophora gregata]KAK0120052.1 hypothetical protein ONS95_011465 [Cadophora gregata]KAK0121085.1 hypothetical protein ONS96_011267 [Cadophora gregata f. sp. sojae]